MLDIWYTIKAEKHVVLIVWIVCILFALSYLMITDNVYRAKSYLLPPTQQDIQPLNLSGDILKPKDSKDSKDYEGMLYTSDDVYRRFIQSLKSRRNRWEFYKKEHVAEALGVTEKDIPEVFFEKNFHEKLVVANDKKTPSDDTVFVSITFDGENPEEATNWVNLYVRDTMDKVRFGLVKEVYAKVSSLKFSLQNEITGKLFTARKRREDRIVMLQEALKVAKIVSADNADSLNIDGLAFNTNDIPLYLLGETALEAEISILSTRKDDAPFVKGLRDLQEKLSVLGEIKINPAYLQPALVDQVAFVPEGPVRPKKLLIVALSIILGFMISVVFVVVRRGFFSRVSKT